MRWAIHSCRVAAESVDPGVRERDAVRPLEIPNDVCGAEVVGATEMENLLDDCCRSEELRILWPELLVDEPLVAEISWAFLHT